MLHGYNKHLRDFLLQGFEYGFRVGFSGPKDIVISKNHKSACENVAACSELINIELRASRLAGPFVSSPFSHYHISPIGLVPKKDIGKFRLIHDLSFPAGSSVNDGIPVENRSVHYEIFDKAIAYIARNGQGVTLSKIDIKSAFRICPVHPCDRHLLGLEWDGKIYFDKTLAMGLASSCKIFERISSALKWIALKNISKVYIAKILDDFLLITECNHPCPDTAFALLKAIFKYLGVPLAEEKCVAPCKKLVYLGLEIDVNNMCIQLPIDKVNKCVQLIEALEQRKKCRLKDIQAVCGLLQFACRAVVPGRAFLRRLYDATRGVSNPNYFLRITAAMREDLAVWRIFLSDYNGRSMFLNQMLNAPEHVIVTDASKTIGFGAICGDAWLKGTWPLTWKSHAITVLEFGPIVFALATWADLFANKSIHVKTDNAALVSVINKQSSSDPCIMFLVRKMMHLSLRYNILLSASHIEGHVNAAADALSRGRFALFQTLHPTADQSSSIIPQEWDPCNWVPPSQA
jgi:hypothetical protein